jgi:hypothetical protein
MPATEGRLLNLIVIGAKKSATISLDVHLSIRPELKRHDEQIDGLLCPGFSAALKL